LVLRLAVKLSLDKALAVCMIPTLPGGILKVLAAAFVALRLRGLIRL